MVRTLFVSLLVFVCLATHAQDYAVSRIPAALLKNANVVKRLDERSFEIVSTKETILRRRWVLTILNEAGQDHAPLVESYDQLNKIVSISGALYDANGKLVEKVKSKEIKDQSQATNDLYNDARLKTHDFQHRSFPYTVEYEVVSKANHTLFLDAWFPQDAEFMSVEAALFIVTTPANLTYRFKSFNYPAAPDSSVNDNKKIRKWQVTSLPAIKKPYASPPWREMTTCVILAPDEFEIQGYKGVMNSWESLAKFQASLNQGRDQLPENIRQKVNELTAGITDPIEKAKLLYQYLQQNTRYISVQLGVGGWQPFDASYVASNGYGDCKALSNYMQSLLKAAGIRSHYATIMAGKGYDSKQILENFPSKQSNHVVLCVPSGKDTLWLECTSQTDPAGYMGAFTGNRKALLVTENGGQLVSTPRYLMNDNLQVRKTVGTLTTGGNLEVEVRTTYTGLQQDDLYSMINQLSKDKIKEILSENLDLPDYDLRNFEHKIESSRLPKITETLQLEVRDYATVTGKRLFITPNLMSKSGQNLVAEERKFDICLSSEYRDLDTVIINIPEGWEVEAMPQPVVLATEFGTYSAKFEFKNNQVLYTRKQEYFAGRFPPSKYSALTNYYAQIYKADRAKVVFVKKDTLM